MGSKSTAPGMTRGTSRPCRQSATSPGSPKTLTSSSGAFWVSPVRMVRIAAGSTGRNLAILPAKAPAPSSSAAKERAAGSAASHGRYCRSSLHVQVRRVPSVRTVRIGVSSPVGSTLRTSAKSALAPGAFERAGLASATTAVNPLIRKAASSVSRLAAAPGSAPKETSETTSSGPSPKSGSSPSIPSSCASGPSKPPAGPPTVPGMPGESPAPEVPPGEAAPVPAVPGVPAIEKVPPVPEPLPVGGRSAGAPAAWPARRPAAVSGAGAAPGSAPRSSAGSAPASGAAGPSPGWPSSTAWRTRRGSTSSPSTSTSPRSMAPQAITPPMSICSLRRASSIVSTSSESEGPAATSPSSVSVATRRRRPVTASSTR